MVDYLTINDKKYALNLKKICEFMFKMTGDNASEREIIESYDSEITKLSGRTIRELKTATNGMESIVYDLLKMIVVQVIAYDNTENDDIEYMPFGTKIAFNTLIKEGFLIEIK